MDIRSLAHREIYIRHGKGQLPDSTTEIQFSVEKG